MDKIIYTVEEIRKKAFKGTYQKLCGRNHAAKEFFGLFMERLQIESDFLLLCSDEGLILDFRVFGIIDEKIPGFRVPMKYLQTCEANLSFFREISGYCIVVDSRVDKSQILELQSFLSAVMVIWDTSEQENKYLLDCLDYVENAISIYDKETRLLFANKIFGDDFYIDDLNDAIGMTLSDILKKYGITMRYFEKTREKYKMIDVINEGKEVIDWEIRLESKNTNRPPRLLSNDMFPIKDKNGNVQGLIEMNHSRQQDVKIVRKIVGLSAEYDFTDIIGVSDVMQEKTHMAREYAKTSYSVLITGESGVGKELFAQAIHNHSPRNKGPFVAINCANFPENLIESELFGYVDGAFTGASKKGQIGKFELADHGTLFLDEIGELPYHFQSKLLRVLETMTVTRIGSSQQIPIDVRVIAATNRNLRTMVSEGFFREDLYYRLQVLNIEVPPLRDRKEDLVLLANNLLEQSKDPNIKEKKKLTANAKRVLFSYDWPGNVRELRNVMSRASILSKDTEITGEILEKCIYFNENLHGRLNVPELMQSDSYIDSLQMQLENTYANLLEEIVNSYDRKEKEKITEHILFSQKKFKEAQIESILKITNGNKKQAAELLGVSRKTFYRILEGLE